MQATILDLRRRMPEVLRALDRQERVTILYRGKPRAVLVPAEGTATATRQAGVSSHPAFGMWADRDDLGDVARHVRTLRQARTHAL
ncbi:MAG: hypothetical protein RLZZ127_1241 [Planctomycetota bacterium]|jgi:prevent-host-death family protein